MNNPEKDSIEIKLATPEDARGIQEVFYKTWLATYPNEEAGITIDDVEDRFKDAFTEEKLAMRRKQLETPGATIQIVAKVDDKVVGIARLDQKAERNQLYALYVLPEYQGTGIGTRLWKSAQEYFDLAKHTIVEVATYNTRAIAYYKKLGFEDNGRRFHDEKFRMKSGAVIPEMEMVLKTKQ